MVRAVLLSDTSPPLYYLLLHRWTRALGTTDLVLQLFSVLWALAAFPLLYLVGRLVVAWLPGIRVVFLNGRGFWDGYRQVAVKVAGWAGPSDLVIVHSIPSGVVGIARYLPLTLTSPDGSSSSAAAACRRMSSACCTDAGGWHWS